MGAEMDALSKVQALLDRLTAEGKHKEAFAIARAQFSASVRASWPGNLRAVASAIDKALADAGDSLGEADRADLRSAAETLRKVPHP
jgi:transcriptional regulator of acetoin/glycerol metabolism